jgi:hypothetical protein
MPITTKNLELYFQHAPTANLTTLAALSTVGMVNGVVIEVISDGIFTLQTPAVAIADGRDVITGSGGGVWIRKTLPALTTAAVGGAITIAKGGTGEVTQQAAIDSLAGAVTSTYYLRGNGTHAVMNTIQAGDVPTLNQNTSGTASKATNIVGGDTNHIPYQTATDVTNFISDANDSVLVTSNAGLPSLSTTLPAVEAGSCTCTDPTTSSSASINTALSNVLGTVPALATAATNIDGGTIYEIPYQTNTDETGFITAAASSVLVTDGSNVPSLSTTLPAVEAGSCTCTDPTTATSASIDDALSNVYSAIVPPLSYHADASAFSLSVAVATAQIITGAQVVLPPGKYLLSYSSSQTFTPTVSNITDDFSANTFIYNTTGSVAIAGTTFTSLAGYVTTGDEIFGGTACASTVSTFTVTTTLDVYTQLNSAAVAGATFVADETAITAVRLANTQATYEAHSTASIEPDPELETPQIVTGAQLVLPAGKYLLSYNASQILLLNGDGSSTLFNASSYIYNTTAVAAVANTTFTSFIGYASNQLESFGGTSSATVAVTLGVTTTLDMYVQLLGPANDTDDYFVTFQMTAVKLD